MSQSGETEGSTTREGGCDSCVIDDDAAQTRCDDGGKDAIDKTGVGRAAETTATGHAAAPSTGPEQTRHGATQTTGRWQCCSETNTGLGGIVVRACSCHFWVQIWLPFFSPGQSCLLGTGSNDKAV